MAYNILMKPEKTKIRFADNWTIPSERVGKEMCSSKASMDTRKSLHG